MSAAVTGSQGLWFLSRGSGLVLLALFSIVVVLGVATRTGSAPARWPRFAVAELHRTLSLFAVALLVLHIVTAILDPFVTIGWAATLLPFASPYRTLAIGLGTLAVDLAGAVLLTSLARRRLGQRAWRAVHWLAYLAWPAAFLHSLTAGNDLGIWWVALIEVGSAVAVATAVLARLFGRARGRWPARARRTGPGTALRQSPADVGCLASGCLVNTADTRYREADGESCLRAGRLPRLLPQRLGGGPASWAEHRARYGALPVPGRDDGWRGQFIAEVGRSGLTGRGGASFPTARKLRAVAAGRDAPVVIANGTEGEPASAKDKVLLAREPHLVLDGAVLAAHLVGARQAFVVVHEAVREIVDRAAAERRQAHSDGIRVKIRTGADRFVGGEASALVNWVGNGVPLPTATPPRVFEHGLDGRPTLVQNVETLAHLALIGRYGAGWFRSLGTAAEPGSMLVTLIGGVHRPGVYEIEIGQPVGEVLELAGGPAAPLSALLIGGYFGTWAGPEAAWPLPVLGGWPVRGGRKPGSRAGCRTARRLLRPRRDRPGGPLPGR